MKKLRKKAAAIWSAALALSLVVTSGVGYPGGGMVAHAEGEIIISTAEDLQKIGTDAAYPLSGDYVLSADIDMAGVDFTPIGGGSGTRGASSGDNVFTGTFDGGNHIISNLSIHKNGNSAQDWQYGLFGIIGSDSDSDKASVKNLILTGVDVNVDMSGSGYLSLGGLAGEINHNAEIDNVAVIDGTVTGNPSNGGDVVGVGGLVGEMRYEAQGSGSWGGSWGGQQTAGNNGVSLSNIYVGADVISGGSKDNNYAAGMIGRIAKSSPASMTACLFTGTAGFKGNSGYGISGGDMKANISNCYYLPNSGIANTGTAVSEEQLKSGTLLAGFSDNYWTAKAGAFILPKHCAQSEVIEGILALSGLSLGLADGDTLSAVSGNFTVPMSIQIGEAAEAITWSCDNPNALSIGADGTVTVNSVYADTSCTLTAATSSGKTKKFKITVLTKVALKINQEYAAVGESLTVSMVNAPEDMRCTYEWKVAGTLKSTGESYTPVNEDLEKMLTVTATPSGDYAGAYQASMYISKLPVLYVNTENNQAITSKEDYLNGNLKIQGNTQYNTANVTLYDGAMKIRGRGNTTWGYDKKPYKVKLDEKTDLFGFGKNKHWVLLANYTDEAHMRNMLSYNLSGEMGMPYMQSVHVDLILNGEYKGTYQFCEQVKIAGSRVDIHDWEDYAGDVAKAVYKAEKDNGLTKDGQDKIETLLAEEDMDWITSGKFTYNNKEYTIADYISGMPKCTGGFLVELDSYYDEFSKFTTDKGQPLQFKSPEFIATNETAMNYVKTYINAFESAVNASDFTTVYQNETVGYSQLFDMDSLVQYWMVNELFMNVDAMKKSTYMYKDIDGLFKMGPIWDMDWSSDSLVSNAQGSGTYNAWQTTKFADAAQADQWYKSIIQDPYFAVKAFELYTQMRAKMGEMTAAGGTLDTYQSLLAESANANANLWYSRENNKKFDTQIAALKTYLTNRLHWLDEQFASPEQLASSLGYKTAGGISVEVKKETNQQPETVVLEATVTDSNVKAVEFLLNGVKIGSVDVVEGKAALEAPGKTLAPTGSYNTVQVFGLDSSGSVAVSGRNKVTDFKKFQAKKPADPDDPGNPDDPDDPSHPNNPDNPDDSNHPNDPGNTNHPSNPNNPGRKKLNAPAKVKAAQLSTSQNVKITFSKVSGAKGYDIYRASKAKGGYKKIGSTKKLSYTDKTVKKAKTYYYKVVAKADKAAYNSALSKKYAKVKALARPSAKAKASKGKNVTVSWRKVTLAQGYVVYTSTKKTKGYKAAKATKKATVGKATIKAPKKAKRLYVKVRPYYKEGGRKVYGPYSKVVSVAIKK